MSAALPDERHGCKSDGLMDVSEMLGVPATALLTVEEAGRVLRIGRSLTYQLAREYEISGGVSGLAVIRLGGCLRVPRWALIELALTGRVVRLCDADLPAGVLDVE
jgi:hypothetical protein